MITVQSSGHSVYVLLSENGIEFPVGGMFWNACEGAENSVLPTHLEKKIKVGRTWRTTY